MNTTTTVALGLMAALLCVAGAAVADPAQESATAQTTECPPLWFDTSGQPHFDPDCVQGPLFDNSP